MYNIINNNIGSLHTLKIDHQQRCIVHCCNQLVRTKELRVPTLLLKDTNTVENNL